MVARAVNDLCLSCSLLGGCLEISMDTTLAAVACHAGPRIATVRAMVLTEDFIVAAGSWRAIRDTAGVVDIKKPQSDVKQVRPDQKVKSEQARCRWVQGQEKESRGHGSIDERTVMVMQVRPTAFTP